MSSFQIGDNVFHASRKNDKDDYVHGIITGSKKRQYLVMWDGRTDEELCNVSDLFRKKGTTEKTAAKHVINEHVDEVGMKAIEETAVKHVDDDGQKAIKETAVKDVVDDFNKPAKEDAAAEEEAIDTTKDGKNNATEVVTTIDKEVSSV